MLNEGSLNYIHISGGGICFDGNTKLGHLTPARFFTKNPISCLFVEFRFVAPSRSPTVREGSSSCVEEPSLTVGLLLGRVAAILSARSTKLHEIHELTPTQPIINVLTALPGGSNSCWAPP